MKAMNTNVVKDFEARVLAGGALPGSGRLLVALSGGADSVALLRVLLSLGREVEAAHCNFHLRGEESNRDEAFVRAFCASLGVTLHVQHFNVAAYVQSRGVSVEMACRDLRYGWFYELAADDAWIVVAHHRDDNIETFFLNALRGTGVAGLGGMKPLNGRVVRPLLGVSRAEIEDYLAGLGQSYVVDSTNRENDFRRNRLRNVVLPALCAQFPEAPQALSDTIAHVQEGYGLLQELLERVKPQLVAEREGVVEIDVEALKSLRNATAFLFEILKPMRFNYAQCAAVVATLNQENAQGKIFSSPTHVLSINRGKLEVFVQEVTLEGCYDIDLNAKNIEIPVKIKIQRFDGAQFNLKQCDGKRVIALDAAVLQCRRVVLRKWQQGDSFQPFGMKGSKLLSDLFCDEKMGEREKREAWLLEADGQILWVLNHRASAAYRVSDNRPYLLLTLQ